MFQIDVRTSRRTEFVDIAGKIQAIIQKSNIKDGVCYLYVPHTTAGITINENADPSVVSDIIHQLEKIAPPDNTYRHTEGNADAHIKSSLMGHSALVFVKNGCLALGAWQGIFFCEFDGPRNRKLYVKTIEEK